MLNIDKNTSEIQKSLMDALRDIDVVDAHEHLWPEEERVKVPVDVFSFFMIDTWNMDVDLYAAGITSEQCLDMANPDLPLEYRWALFKPYWEKIRYMSSSRATLIAIEKFFGFDDLNDQTYAPISAEVQRMNRPGIYDKVLKDACRIKAAITQCGTTKTGSSMLLPVVPIVFACEEPTWNSLVHPRADNLGGMRGYDKGWKGWPVFDPGTVINTLDDYVSAVEKYITGAKEEGAIGVKMYSLPSNPPSRSEAVAVFERLKNGSIPYLKEYGDNPLRDYVWDRVISVATELGLVMAVHTGFGGDFRYLDPVHLVPILQRHPEARFDVYHLGYPWVRETLMLAKSFRNVWLNLCGIQIISQNLAASAIYETADLLPVDRVIAFGADHCIAVEKVYGHLVEAKENVSKALAGMVAEDKMTEGQAVQVAKKWFYDNPKALYRLDSI